MKPSLKDSITGNLACFTAYLIFGFNIVFCKNIASDGHLSPVSLFLLRSIGALLLFWITAAVFHIREKVEKGDMWKIAVASFLGLFLTQFSFLKAITMTTAVDASILSLLSPVMAMIVGSLVLKDHISLHGVVGLAVSLAGVLFIVLNSVSSHSGADHTSLGGVLLMIVNTLSFASYTVLFKKLIGRYHVVTFMKWMFVFSTLFALPFGGGLLKTDFAAIPADIVLQILYVVVGATFVSYFLIPIGQKKLKPVMVCMYVYIQPVVAMGISLAAGLDTMTWAKAFATVLVFAGVGLVNFSPHHPQKNLPSCRQTPASRSH